MSEKELQNIQDELEELKEMVEALGRENARLKGENLQLRREKFGMQTTMNHLKAKVEYYYQFVMGDRKHP